MNGWLAVFKQRILQKLPLNASRRDVARNLSMLSVGFAASKVFSIVSVIIIARVFGPANFGDAFVIATLAQVFSNFLLFGLHISIMKFASAKENPAPEISVAVWLVIGICSVFCSTVSFNLDEVATLLQRWMTMDALRLKWALLLAVAISLFTLFSSCYQVLNSYKQRTIVEIALAFFIMPGLVLGYIWRHGTYETVIFSYCFSYAILLAYMFYRFRRLYAWKNFDFSLVRKLCSYGFFASLSNIGYLLTFTLQPLQVDWALDSSQAGLYRLYCSGSIHLAVFAAGIFYAVLFPRFSSSTNREGIWKTMARLWLYASLPALTIYFVAVLLTLLASGDQYPLIISQAFLYGLAATVITVHSSFNQLLVSQGLRGIRWGVAISLLSGVISFVGTAKLLPIYGFSGAIYVLLGNAVFMLASTITVGQLLIRKGALNSD